MKFGVTAPNPLPDSTHVGRVRLQVSDVARSLAFYEQIVGLHLLEHSATHAQLGVDDVVLVELHAGATRPLSARHLGLYHFAILLPDRPSLGIALKRLIEHGIQPGAADHLVSEALYISDPDGLGIEIYRDRPREEWTVRDNQLMMSSDPLDFEGLLTAGRPDRLTALPSKTVIGHVHLHVGDLETARKFYHDEIGLDLVVWSYPGALFLSAGGYHHHLGLNTWAGPNAQPAGPEMPKLLNWQLVIPESGRESAVREDPWGTAVDLSTSPK